MSHFIISFITKSLAVNKDKEDLLCSHSDQSKSLSHIKKWHYEIKLTFGETCTVKQKHNLEKNNYMKMKWKMLLYAMSDFLKTISWLHCMLWTCLCAYIYQNVLWNQGIKVITMTMRALYEGIKFQMSQSYKSQGPNIQAEIPMWDSFKALTNHFQPHIALKSSSFHLNIKITLYSFALSVINGLRLPLIDLFHSDRTPLCHHQSANGASPRLDLWMLSGGKPTSLQHLSRNLFLESAPSDSFK